MPTHTLTTAPATRTRWNRDERGSADRHQMRAYAYAVTVAVTGGTCPLTGASFDPATGEVDRVTASLGYVPGNVILTSVAGNQGRSALQSIGADVPNVSRYVADVTAASALVNVPTCAEGARIVAGWGKPDYRAAVLAGPYGA